MAETLLDPGTVTCPKCRLPLPEEGMSASRSRPCPGCGAALWVSLFPALHRPLASEARGEAILVDGEASCYYHPEKRAVAPCSRCGRFLCQLCDVMLGEDHVCASCLHAGQTKGTFVKIQKGRVLWDTTALIVALLPTLFIWPTLVTGPIALVLGIIALKKPNSLVRRSRWRAWVAILIGLLQTLGWIALLVVFIIGITSSENP